MPVISTPSHNQNSYLLLSRDSRPGWDVTTEARKLQSEGLIGGDSLILAGSAGASITYWNEQEHAQWQAYQEDKSNAARQAAAFQQQMVSERQGLVTGYLAKVAEVSAGFSKLDLPNNVTFHKVLDNAQAGRPIVDGITNEYAQSIQEFWRDNQAQIGLLNSQYKALETFPRDLETWLGQQSSAVNDEVFQVVERLKNSWSSTGKVEAGEDYRPNTVNIQIVPDDSGGQSAQVVANSESGLSLIRSMERNILKSAQHDYTSNSHTADQSRLANIAAQELLSQQLQQTYQEMQTLSRNLFAEFGNQFGQNSGHADYSLQDMIDNYLEEKPLATLDDGTLHPMADQIKTFWQENKAMLNQYASRQRRLNELPNDLSTYIQSNEKAIKHYLLENLDRFLSMEVELDR